MAGKVYYKNDAFYDLLRFYLVNPGRIHDFKDSRVHLIRTNECECPAGYKGITVFFKESEIEKYVKD